MERLSLQLECFPAGPRDIPTLPGYWQVGPEAFWGATKPSCKALLTGGVQAVQVTQETSVNGVGGSSPPKRGGRRRGSPLQALAQRLHKVASAIRRETMSDSEFQHIIVQAIIKHQFNTLTRTHRALLPPPHQPQRAEQPLPFPAHKEVSTKGHGRVRIENRNNKKTPLGS